MFKIFLANICLAYIDIKAHSAASLNDGEHQPLDLTVPIALIIAWLLA